MDEIYQKYLRVNRSGHLVSPVVVGSQKADFSQSNLTVRRDCTWIRTYLYIKGRLDTGAQASRV